MENEERQLDPGAYATEFDLADLRSEVKAEMLEFKNEMLQLKSELEEKIADVRIAVSGLEGQMKWIFGLLMAILAAILGMFFKEIFFS